MYPKPDRSNSTPSFRKTPEDPAVDLGWNEGYPETAWVPGDFEVSVYMRTTSDSNRKMLARFSHEIGAEALENAARGTAIYLTPKFTPSPA